MYTGRTVFPQVMDYLPMRDFRKCVERYSGNYQVKSFSCLDQFLCMAFAQLTYRESLRDIEVCLRSMHERLYHLRNDRDSAYFLPAWTAKALLQEEAAKISGIAYVMETYVKDAKKILTE